VLADKGIILAYLPDTITLAVPSGALPICYFFYQLPNGKSDQRIFLSLKELTETQSFWSERQESSLRSLWLKRPKEAGERSLLGLRKNNLRFGKD